MYRRVSVLHISIMDCRRSLQALDFHSAHLKMPAMAEVEDHLVADAITIVSREAFRIRAQKRQWTMMHPSLKSLLPDPGPHRIVMRIAEMLSHAIGLATTADDASIFHRTGQQWCDTLTNYRASLLDAHLELPSENALSGVWPDVQSQAFARAFALATTKKGEAQGAANQALGNPHDPFLRPTAEFAKREFGQAVDMAICLARSPEQSIQVEELLTVDYAPLEQIGQ